MPRVLSTQTVDQIESLCAKYPNRMAAMIPALHLAQDEVGHISDEVASDIAELLDVPLTRVREVVTFYTMLYDRPVGRNVVKICRNLSCQLRGASHLIERAKELLGIEIGETTADGRVTLETDECLASCGTAPMLWCKSKNGDGVEERIVENLDVERLEKFLEGLS